ncbi:MAG: methylenetetrahydrofolate reductase C-terminal domain-containing protein [Ideonella sp.]|nr:methylenetetrahydrofolate reductase C-terminal domain-containing protein [Ideonella sp.]
MYAVRLWSVRHARALRRVYEFFSALAPRLAPLVRLLGRRRTEALLHPIERAAKSLMFDCRECGQCVLSATGMACPMNCAKQMRNGPCGGVRADGSCEVDPAMRCVWVEATAGGKSISGDAVARPTPLLPAIDMRKAGRSTWIQVIEGRPDPAFQPPVGARSLPESEIGPLERACADGRFVVTIEIAPPDSADPQALLARAARFDGLADALNITDGAGANCHMSSVAGAAILAAHGYNPVYQVACRDRNRIAIQGDILGAAALGVKNILCLTGDDVSQGDHPQAKPVFDLDAVSLLHIARGMCDKGEFASGRKLERAPDLFIGATVNPFVPPYRDRVANLEKKIVAGARFIQTQFCFDVALFEDFMHEVRRRELHRRTRIIVGVGTLGSAKALAWMASHVPGVHVPQSLLERIARADDQKLEGQRACIETIAALRQIEGVAGVHVMGHRNEDALAGIIEQALGRRGAAT